MHICVQAGLGRLMLDTSLVVNSVNYMEVLHDLLRTGEVRALNEKPHQHLLKTEISVLQCYSQLSLAAFVLPSQNQQVKSIWRVELFLTVLPVLHHIAALAARTWPSCSVRVSQETSSLKGLSGCECSSSMSEDCWGDLVMLMHSLQSSHRLQRIKTWSNWSHRYINCRPVGSEYKYFFLLRFPVFFLQRKGWPLKCHGN